MGKGLISNRTLTDIANAIRWQQYSGVWFTPGAMGAAVAALDGNHAGSTYGEEDLPTELRGLVERDSLQAVADAIRAQNGEATLYKPRDMAAAIRALAWVTEPSLTGVLLDDGTLVVGYFATYAPPAGKTVAKTYADVPPDNSGAATNLPWDGDRAQIQSVVIDETVEQAGITSIRFWFASCYNLVELSGFEHLSGVTNAYMAFSYCSSLETVWCDGTFDTGALTATYGTFYGCYRLVGGGHGTIGTSSYAGTRATVGGTGLLTAHDDDAREWLYAYGYSGDGAGGGNAVVVTPSPMPDASRALVKAVRVDPLAVYSSTPLPGVVSADGFSAATVSAVAVDANVGGTTFSEMHADCWCSGYTGLQQVSGMGNLHDLVSMDKAFNACSSLPTLDLSGLSPAKLTSCSFAFNGCSTLTTIYADAGFAMPSGHRSTSVFTGCGSLVGGAGTAWSSTATSSDYLRIDGGVEAPGYLTLATGAQ